MISLSAILLITALQFTSASSPSSVQNSESFSLDSTELQFCAGTINFMVSFLVKDILTDTIRTSEIRTEVYESYLEKWTLPKVDAMYYRMPQDDVIMFMDAAVFGFTERYPDKEFCISKLAMATACGPIDIVVWVKELQEDINLSTNVKRFRDYLKKIQAGEEQRQLPEQRQGLNQQKQLKPKYDHAEFRSAGMKLKTVKPMRQEDNTASSSEETNDSGSDDVFGIESPSPISFNRFMMALVSLFFKPAPQDPAHA